MALQYFPDHKVFKQVNPTTFRANVLRAYEELKANAKENGQTYEGDWTILAILVDGASGRYVPKFFYTMFGVEVEEEVRDPQYEWYWDVFEDYIRIGDGEIRAIWEALGLNELVPGAYPALGHNDACGDFCLMLYATDELFDNLEEGEEGE